MLFHSSVTRSFRKYNWHFWPDEKRLYLTNPFLFFLNDEPAHEQTRGALSFRRARRDEIRENNPRAVMSFP